MTDDDIARIRQRAYEIWMDEGTPGDRAEANWLQAEEELAREADTGQKAWTEEVDLAVETPPRQTRTRSQSMN